MHIPVLKIVVHKTEQQDTVFIFTSLRYPGGLKDYINFQITCPAGEGESWVRKELGTPNYEVAPEGFEIVAPL